MQNFFKEIFNSPVAAIDLTVDKMFGSELWSSEEDGCCDSQSIIQDVGYRKDSEKDHFPPPCL